MFKSTTLLFINSFCFFFFFNNKRKIFQHQFSRKALQNDQKLLKKLKCWQGIGNPNTTEAVELIPLTYVKTIIRETLKHEFVYLGFWGPDGVSLEGNCESTSLAASKPASLKDLFKNATQRGKHISKCARALQYPSTSLANGLLNGLCLSYNRRIRMYQKI